MFIILGLALILAGCASVAYGVSEAQKKKEGKTDKTKDEK